MKKKYLVLVVIGALLALAGLTLWVKNDKGVNGEKMMAPQKSLSIREVSLSSGVTLSAMVAEGEAERVLGLSGYPGLDKREGMLFIFDEPGKQAIWMKDMLFPLDILWFNDKRELVHIVERATPDSYPTTIFYSNENALYVLEVPEGFVAENGIKLGDTFSFK